MIECVHNYTSTYARKRVQLDKKHWYEHVPKSVETNQGDKGTCMLIDIAISGDRNVIKKEGEKILKYKNLAIEIQRMWNVKTKVIPVIIGAIGSISKSFRKYVSSIPGKHEVKELQKTAILGTAHILQKVR